MYRESGHHGWTLTWTIFQVGPNAFLANQRPANSRMTYHRILTSLEWLSKSTSSCCALKTLVDFDTFRGDLVIAPLSMPGSVGTFDHTLWELLTKPTDSQFSRPASRLRTSISSIFPPFDTSGTTMSNDDFACGRALGYFYLIELNKALAFIIVECLYEIESILTFGGGVVNHLCIYYGFISLNRQMEWRPPCWVHCLLNPCDSAWVYIHIGYSLMLNVLWVEVFDICLGCSENSFLTYALFFTFFHLSVIRIETLIVTTMTFCIHSTFVFFTTGLRSMIQVCLARRSPLMV